MVEKHWNKHCILLSAGMWCHVEWCVHAEDFWNVAVLLPYDIASHPEISLWKFIVTLCCRMGSQNCVLMHFTFQSFFCIYTTIYMNVSCISTAIPWRCCGFSSHQQMLKCLKLNSEFVKGAMRSYSGNWLGNRGCLGFTYLNLCMWTIQDVLEETLACPSELPQHTVLSVRIATARPTAYWNYHIAFYCLSELPQQNLLSTGITTAHCTVHQNYYSTLYCPS